jgi:hypothetical protein
MEAQAPMKARLPVLVLCAAVPLVACGSAGSSPSAASDAAVTGSDGTSPDALAGDALGSTDGTSIDAAEGNAGSDGSAPADAGPLEWTLLPFDGGTFPSVAEVDFVDVWGRAANDLYVVGQHPVLQGCTAATCTWWAGPFIIHSTGDGNWSEQTIVAPDGGTASFPAPAYVNGIWGTAEEGYAVGDLGIVLHSSGGVWVTGDSGTSVSLKGISGTGPNDIYAVGAAGTILHSSDGSTWTAQDSGTTVSLFRIWGSGPSDVYAVGQNGTILHSKGDGSWTREASNTTNDIHGIWGSSPSNVYALGLQQVLRSTGDRTWTQEAAFTGIYFYSLWGSGPADINIGSWYTEKGPTYSGIYRSVGDGQWVSQLVQATASDPNSSYFWGIWGSGPGDVYAVGDRGHILHRP